MRKLAARTTEARIATINAKIEKKQSEIAALEAQKHKLEHPVTQKDSKEGVFLKSRLLIMENDQHVLNVLTFCLEV